VILCFTRIYQELVVWHRSCSSVRNELSGVHGAAVELAQGAIILAVVTGAGKPPASSRDGGEADVGGLKKYSVRSDGFRFLRNVAGQPMSVKEAQDPKSEQAAWDNENFFKKRGR
jgi:hypothetical protein